MSEAIGGNVSVPLLQRAYALVADLWCNPGHVEVEQVRQEAEGVVRALKEIDQEAASLLARFLADYPPPEEEYVELFELNPRCPLYLPGEPRLRGAKDLRPSRCLGQERVHARHDRPL